MRFQQITPPDITVTLVVSAMRSFLRYLFHRGIVDIDLAASVPAIATWSLSHVPKFLAAAQIEKILDSCDKETAIGKRDYAVLLLLARLGLRAAEVVALTLDDVDWEAGLITVRGKGSRFAQMPLPSEVGSAIAEYLFTARPRCFNRRLFIRTKAPLTGFANSVAICSLVDRAPGEGGSRIGASRLTHTCFVTAWLRGCSTMAHPSMRSVNCCGIDIRTPPESTPRWIWRRFVLLRFRGQEAPNETPATSDRRLHRAPAQSGIQAPRCRQ